MRKFFTFEVFWDSRADDMKTLTEVIASLLLALVMLRASGSLFDIIHEWKLRAGKS
jgi:hypothetical protein